MGASRVDPTTRRMFAAFFRAAALVEPLQREIAARHGIALADLHALRVLELTGAVPVSHLGGELGLARSSATNLVDRLERAGLVERSTDRQDRRVTLVRLSKAGLEALESFEMVRQSDLVPRLLSLDEAERATFADLLDRITAPSEETPA
jgi:MarR family transcriptional regulator, organic hydroperoxide resistance regulator